MSFVSAHKCAIVAAIALSSGCLMSQGVSQQEFNRLKKRLNDLQAQAVTQDSLDGLSDEIRNDILASAGGAGGTTSFLLAGYGQATLEAPEGGTSTFGATFNPIFLWNMANNLSFESEIEVEIAGNATKFALEYAQISYNVCDFMTVSAGKFLNPFGVFRERLHSAWVNKLPDKPLGYAGGANKLVPSTQMGAQVRGSYPFQGNDLEVNYAVYVTNGSSIKTSAGSEGLLNLGLKTDSNQNKAIGGRIGIAYQAGLEVGVSYETGRGMSSVGTADVTFFGFDANFHREIEQVQGTVDARVEYVSSDVGDLNYGGAIGMYDNSRNAIYFQVAYRPSKMEQKFLKNSEIVVRVDTIDQPSGAGVPGNDTDRVTFGFNYWLGESSAIKIAWRSTDVTGGQDSDDFLMQWSVGL